VRLHRRTAVDAKQSIVYTTYTTRAGNSRIEAWSYDAATNGITLSWATDVIDGNVTSPVLSADYQRIYVETSGGALRAIDAADGVTVWTAALGYSSSAPKEPVVNEFGYIMPGGDPSAREVAILRDLGETFEWSFRGQRFAPLSQAAAARGNRFVLAARRRTNGNVLLLVVNPFHGVINETVWDQGPAPTDFTGVTIREDGWVFLGGGESTTYKAYRPVWPEF
jgi:outer membrane protein assembly factor BamB